MITVFGHLEEAVITGCAEVIFNGGPNGGSVTFFRCGLTRPNTINLFPNEDSLAFCVENNSWTFGDYFMTASLIGPCTAIAADDGSGTGGGSGPNVFAVERVSDGFSTYAQYSSTWIVNDTVSLSNDTACYEIMSIQTVTDPQIFPAIAGSCSSSGGGPFIKPSP